MKPSITLVAAACLLLGACVTKPITPASSIARVQIQYDEFKKLTRWTGSDVDHDAGDTLMLRAWKPDAGRMQYQIYVSDFYRGNWRFYEAAHDDQGRRHDVTLISRRVVSCYNSCTYDETLALNIERDYIEAHRESGITFKVSGSAGEAIFHLPPIYVSTWLDQVREP